MTILDMLGERLEALNEALDNVEPGSREYTAIVTQMDMIHDRILKEEKAELDNQFRNLQENRAERQLRLDEMKEERLQEEAKKPAWKKVDGNAILAAVATVLTTFGICKFEVLNNLTTKAMAFVPKPRFR